MSDTAGRASQAAPGIPAALEPKKQSVTSSENRPTLFGVTL